MAETLSNLVISLRVWRANTAPDLSICFFEELEGLDLDRAAGNNGQFGCDFAPDLGIEGRFAFKKAQNLGEGFLNGFGGAIFG